MSRILFQEWFPQIMYNHHQTGPTVPCCSRRRFVTRSTKLRSGHPRRTRPWWARRCNSRFVAEASRALRCAAAPLLDMVERRAAHDGLLPQHDRLLTETIGNHDADRDRVRAAAQPRERRTPFPITPAEVHFPAVDRYSVTANYATCFDVASLPPRAVPLQHLQDGQELDRARQPRQLDSTPKGSTQCAQRERRISARPPVPWFNPAAAPAACSRPRAGPLSRCAAKYSRCCGDPKKRDPRGYVLPAGQADFLTATTFVHALQRSGIEVHRATTSFTSRAELFPRLVRHKVRAGVPPARARPVRAAGPS